MSLPFGRQFGCGTTWLIRARTLPDGSVKKAIHSGAGLVPMDDVRWALEAHALGPEPVVGGTYVATWK